MERDCAGGDRGGDTLMRHYFLLRCPTQAVAALAGRMMSGTAAAALVAPPGGPQRLAPANARTRPGAVTLAPVAAAAHAHALPAAPTAIEPMTRRLLPLHAPSQALDSTQARQA
jgi:hypothetical protein